MASIRKTKSGKWQATVYIGRDGNGKQMREYITCDTQKECKALARELEQEVSEGKITNIRKKQLSIWLDEWLNLYENRLSPSTVPSYKIYINKHFKPFFKKIRLSEVDEYMIEDYINEKLETLSPTTVRKHFFVLKKALEFALKDKNPCRYIDAPSSKKYKPHVVTDEELNLIISKVKGSLYEIVALLAAWCGLRRSEICGLKWDDVDWVEKTIRIDEARVIVDGGLLDKSPKSDNGFRIVQAPDILISMLEEYRKNNMSTVRIFDISPSTVTHKFMDVFKVLDIKMRFHDMRHYHSNWMYKNKIPDHHAAKRLGHDINTLKRIYQHLEVETHKELEQNIVNLINNN